MEKAKKLQAIKLAYHIVTDKRNESRYRDTFLINEKTGTSITYPEMIDALAELYTEVDKNAAD